MPEHFGKSVVLMDMRFTARALLAVVLLLVLVCVSSGLAAGSRETGAVVLHPTWRVVGREIFATGAPSLFSDGRYVLAWRGIGPGDYPAASSGLLIDDNTGRRRDLPFPSGCYPVATGGSWFGFTCTSLANQYLAELYAPGSGRWRTVTPSQSLASRCTYSGQCSISLAAAGRYWVAWSWGDGCEHCLPAVTFQSLKTGRLRTLSAWQPGGTVIPDVSSQSLAHKLCKPLRVPTTAEGGLPGPGALTLYGRFAVVPMTNIANGYLQRCGSAHRYQLDGVEPVGNLTAIVWSGAAHETTLSGRFLPSLRTFSVRTPVPINYGNQWPVPELALGPRHLYMLDHEGRLWASVAPTSPRGRQ